MGSLLKTAAAAVAAFAALGFTAASAEHEGDRHQGDRYQGDRSRPDRCDTDHDHRSHAPNYYDYYGQDRYSRAGAYSGVSVSVDLGGRRRNYDDRDGYGYGDRYRDRDGGRYDDRRGDRYGDNYGRPRSRVLHRDVIPTRYDARIIIVEEAYYTRRGDEQRVCTVQARGPDHHFVPYRQLRRLANIHCSHYADVRILQ
jgi:hypothetical protein